MKFNAFRAQLSLLFTFALLIYPSIYSKIDTTEQLPEALYADDTLFANEKEIYVHVDKLEQNLIVNHYDQKVVTADLQPEVPLINEQADALPSSERNRVPGFEPHELNDEKNFYRRYDRILPSKPPLTFDLGELTGRIQIKWKPETFYAVNSNLLNSRNSSDRLFLNRSSLDISFDFLYGRKSLGYDVAEFFVTLRNQNIWGNPESIAQTTESEVKLLEVVFGGHRHFITRNMVWIREIWLKFCLNDALGLGFKHNHYFTLGSFPFELGRGIALGSAFAVSQRFLGFYSDTSINQYAYGFKLSGEFFKDKLFYDLYGAILENKSDSFTNTTLKVRGQEFGRRYNQERGSGRVNFVMAGRLKWHAIKYDCNSLIVEPYILYNRSPEQTVEFIADARAQLGTAGIAGEFVNGPWEGGIDSAFNFGRQFVLGWDRNRIEFENRSLPIIAVPDSTVVVVNTRVVTADPNVVARPPRAYFDPNSTDGRAAQQIIDNTGQDASQNGAFIGSTGGTDLYNDLNRFRNPHSNKFQGWMVVGDLARWFRNKTIRIAGTFGYTSGDRDPNQNLDDPNSVLFDGNFKGFVGLQELYSGVRVQSAFFLGGAGRVPRPLSVPNPDDGISELPTQVNGLTNLMFIGSSINWFPKTKRSITVRPNILWYWQTFATNKFDITTGQSAPNEFARNFYGTELNSFVDVELIKDLKGFLVWSVFIPGGHYTDIKGTPLNRDQLKILDSVDVTGVDSDILPLLGDDTAFTINIGLEYKF